MKTSKELKEERGLLRKQMQGIIETAEKEKRNITDEEATKFDDLEARKADLDKQIERAEKMEKFKRESMANNGGATTVTGGEEKEKRKVAKRYSIARVVQGHLRGAIDGVEKEMHEEALKEARASGTNFSGYGIPRMLVDFIGKEKRTLEVAVDATAGNLVDTEKRDFIPVLRPRLKVIEMGAQVLTGLNGNVEITTQDSASAASWAGEKDTAANSEPSFGTFTMSPKRLAAYAEYTRQMFLQSYVALEPIVRNDLEMAVAIALDKAAINGSGVGFEPKGILNWAGIGSVAGKSGRELLVDLETAIATENADAGMLKYLTTPGIRGLLRKTKTDAGSGQFIWDARANSLLGYEAHVSTQVPNDLGGTNHAMIYGDFSKVCIGNWGGIDLIVNPYTKAKESIVELVINSYWDVAVKQPKALAAAKDLAV